MKQFISAQEFLDDSFTLAKMIDTSDFVATVVIALWRGGALPGATVSEYLAFKNKPVKHFALGVSSYSDVVTPHSEVKVQPLSPLLSSVTPQDLVLVVDELCNSGRSLHELRRRLREEMGVEHIRTAVVYNRVHIENKLHQPDFFVHGVENMVVLPYELVGLTEKELEEHRDFL